MAADKMRKAFCSPPFYMLLFICYLSAATFAAIAIFVRGAVACNVDIAVCLMFLCFNALCSAAQTSYYYSARFLPNYIYRGNIIKYRVEK